MYSEIDTFPVVEGGGFGPVVAGKGRGFPLTIFVLYFFFMFYTTVYLILYRSLQLQLKYNFILKISIHILNLIISITKICFKMNRVKSFYNLN